MVGLNDGDHTTAAVCLDLDDDGDIDIATLSVSGPLRVFENTLGAGAHFLTVDLEGIAPNRAGIGARVVVRSGTHQQSMERRIDNTHTSGQSTRLHFGLPHAGPVDVAVQWTDGLVSERRGIAADQHHRLRHPLAQ